MTCRDEILACIEEITAHTGMAEFSAAQIIECMRARGSRYKVSTIQTHLSSRMRVDAPKNHATKYDDIIQVQHGLYRLHRNR
jgi:hypothetical protein